LRALGSVIRIDCAGAMPTHIVRVGEIADGLRTKCGVSAGDFARPANLIRIGARSASSWCRLLACVGLLAMLPAAPASPEQLLPRPRPQAAAPMEGSATNALPDPARLPPGFRELAKSSGEPQIPGLTIVYLHPLGSPAEANRWQNLIVHQTEGPPGSAQALALQQSKNPTKRGVMIWVETDGTVYWSTAETAIPTHGDGANRNDNRYIDNAKTYRSVVRTNSIGVEFVGNYPNVAAPATREQRRAWLLLVRFLQERYGIPPEHIYAHNWIDFKDRRYCEGCELATLARRLGYQPGQQAAKDRE
jgi:N-acetylmuramoyl-L-alanine amidase-like protein